MSAKAIKTTIAALWAVFAALLTACAGGSGSSGFLSEAAVIQDVLDTGECMLLDGLEICPAGVAPTPTPVIEPTQPTATATPEPTNTMPEPTDTVAAPQGTATPQPTDGFNTPSATATAPATNTQVEEATRTATRTASPTATTVPFPMVDVVPAPIFAADCSAFSIAGPCVVLQVQPSGFPPSSVFYLASREQDSEDEWLLSPASPDSDAPLGSPALYAAAIPLPPDVGMDGSDASPLQIVVLAYFDRPSDVPTTIDRLADSGADQAFALAPVFL